MEVKLERGEDMDRKRTRIEHIRDLEWVFQVGDGSFAEEVDIGTVGIRCS